MPGKSNDLKTDILHDKELATLVEASALINRSLDLAETLQAIAESAAAVLDSEASSVLILDPIRNVLVFEAASGAAANALIGNEMAADLGIAGHVIRTGHPKLLSNVRDDPNFFEGIDQKSDFFTRDMVAAPIKQGENVLGVVEVLNRKDDRGFDERDANLLQVFANLAANGVANAQTHQSVERENRGLREAVFQSDEIIGDSESWQQAMNLCDRVAKTNSTVLLLGETGTGKEVCAQFIHTHSDRNERAFIAINCAALPETLLESELFGHEAGAFTGATAAKQGRFELADGGTLFLDEVGDISVSTQIKLLRVLQEREFVRVGGTKTHSCDVRIIAATNRDLKVAMEAGEFREDLFYRLNVFPINLPPLRERHGDIPALVDHFVKRSAVEFRAGPMTVSPEAMAQFNGYAWPGNVRELRNVIERSVLMRQGSEITPEELPREIVVGEPMPQAQGAASVEAYEKSMIIKTLKEHNWNQTQTAKSIGWTRDNLRYRLRKYNIERPTDV